MRRMPAAQRTRHPLISPGGYHTRRRGNTRFTAGNARGTSFGDVALRSVTRGRHRATIGNTQTTSRYDRQLERIWLREVAVHGPSAASVQRRTMPSGTKRCLSAMPSSLVRKFYGGCHVFLRHDLEEAGLVVNRITRQIFERPSRWNRRSAASSARPDGCLLVGATRDQGLMPESSSSAARARVGVVPVNCFTSRARCAWS